MIYIFDGSLEGILTAVFEYFERKPKQVLLTTESLYQPDAFSESFHVANNREKADRVLAGLEKRLDKKWIRRLCCAYLSENPQSYQDIFHFALYIFHTNPGAEKNYGNEYVLSISQIAIKVEREKHRMEAFIRFQLTSDGIFYCPIDPDFNVLPLIINHFKNRYADQKWIIYDIKRQYGLYYDLEKVEEISFKETPKISQTTNQQLDHKEELYADLWKDYFKSTNIVSRKNTKLHVRHVPKRYWKYLTEKQIDV